MSWSSNNMSDNTPSSSSTSSSSSNTGLTRHGNPFRGQPVVSTKPYNVSGRAAAPDGTTILFTDNEKVLDQAKNFEGVKVYRQKVTLDDVYPIIQKLKKETNADYLLIDYREDWLYFAKGPLKLYPPRGNAAEHKGSYDRFNQISVKSDKTVVVKKWKQLPAKGSETPERSTVMGGTARNYAAFVYDKNYAESYSWEWLHIVGHSLGGHNEVQNLVAGTFPANTQMIPVEQSIQKALLAGYNVMCTFTVECYPNTRMAMYIEMDVVVAEKTGNQMSSKHTFNCTSNLPFDKFQYQVGTFESGNTTTISDSTPSSGSGGDSAKMSD
jgi:hypothetical protein